MNELVATLWIWNIKRKVTQKCVDETVHCLYTILIDNKLTIVLEIHSNLNQKFFDSTGGFLK